MDLPYRIVTYNGKPTDFTVYALNRGMNTGKPSSRPFRNCFAIICKDRTTQERIYALLMVLLKARAFEMYLTGSVIPFIHLRDFKDVLLQQRGMIDDTGARMMDVVLAMVSRIDVLEKSVVTSKDLLTAYARSIMK